MLKQPLEAAPVRHQQAVPGPALPGRRWNFSLTLSDVSAPPGTGGRGVGDPLRGSTPIQGRQWLISCSLSTLVGFSPGIMRIGACAHGRAIITCLFFHEAPPLCVTLVSPSVNTSIPHSRECLSCSCLDPCPGGSAGMGWAQSSFCTPPLPPLFSFPLFPFPLFPCASWSFLAPQEQVRDVTAVPNIP